MNSYIPKILSLINSLDDSNLILSEELTKSINLDFYRDIINVYYSELIFQFGYQGFDYKNALKRISEKQSKSFFNLDNIDFLSTHGLDMSIFKLLISMSDFTNINNINLKTFKDLLCIQFFDTKFTHLKIYDPLEFLAFNNCILENVYNINFQPSINTLKRLTFLNCGLNNIPPSIWKFPKLEYLNLACNNIESIDSLNIPINCSKNIKELYLYETKLNDSDDYSKLKDFFPNTSIYM